MRTIRVSLSPDELRHIVGALRERVDNYAEELGEVSGHDGEATEWLIRSLDVIRPLERRLTKRGNLEPHA